MLVFLETTEAVLSRRPDGDPVSWKQHFFSIEKNASPRHPCGPNANRFNRCYFDFIRGSGAGGFFQAMTPWVHEIGA